MAAEAREVEEPRLGAPLPHGGVDADQEVEGADQGEDQVRPVDGQRRAPVDHGLQGAAAEDGELGDRGGAEGLAQRRPGLATAGEEDLVAALEADLGMDDLRHGPTGGGAVGHEAQGLEGVEGPDEAHHAERRHHEGCGEGHPEGGVVAKPSELHRDRRLRASRISTFRATETNS